MNAIVSYDDTDNDIDALALGRVLRDAGSHLTLAYVRHWTHRLETEERVAQREAEALLARGAARLGDPEVDRRVVVSASTGKGLAWLAERERAELIVFGSEYRTRAGHVSIGRSAQTLLEGGPAALALAPAGYSSAAREIETVGVLRGTADEAAIETAFSVAERLGASVVDRGRNVDLLIVGSRPQGPVGRLTVTSSALHAIDEADCPVLAVACGAALEFETLALA